MTMNKRAVAAASGVRVEALEFWLDQRWLVPTDAPDGDGFTEADAARARLIRELRDDFGANVAGIDIILHLLDQLHDMRRTMAEMRSRFEPGGKEG